MSEQATSTGERPAAGGSAAEPHAELTRQKQEILRLRDLLITKDAELGAAKGRLAEIDERAARLTNIATRIEGRLPGVGKLLGTAVRMLRSQRP